jgi:hypothetical protein
MSPKERRPPERQEIARMRAKMSAATRPRRGDVILYERHFSRPRWESFTESAHAEWGKYGKDWLFAGETKAHWKYYSDWEPVYQETYEEGGVTIYRVFWPGGDVIEYR